MKFIKKPSHRLELGDDHWIDRAIEEVAGFSRYECNLIELPDHETAFEFVQLILRKYVELTPVAGTGVSKFFSSRDREKAFSEIGTVRQADFSDCRFVGNPEISRLESGEVSLRRNVEIRVGRKVEVLKTIVFEGEEFTRKISEEKWSSWYPGFQEVVSIYIYKTYRVVPVTDGD
jgi:hypothetical protein